MTELEALKKDNAELTQALYAAYARIRELAESKIDVNDRVEVLRTISGDERTW